MTAPTGPEVRERSPVAPHVFPWTGGIETSSHLQAGSPVSGDSRTGSRHRSPSPGPRTVPVPRAQSAPLPSRRPTRHPPTSPNPHPLTFPHTSTNRRAGKHESLSRPGAKRQALSGKTGAEYRRAGSGLSCAHLHAGGGQTGWE